MDQAVTRFAEELLEVGTLILNPPSDVAELLPILDRAGVLLYKVDQSPAPPVLTALAPAMKGLVATELLRNPNMDVKVAVASCINEIVRITAPEPPYENKLMREIFGMFVEAFKGLNEVDSRLFSKRVSILETVAAVRSCVVMLDLECKELIIQMFSLFFHTVSEGNAKKVMPLMEIIMTDILEESEDIPVEILSCILDSVKMDNKGVSRILGKKVIGNCAAKLKPYLSEAIACKGADLSGYSRIIWTICQNILPATMHIDRNASGSDDDFKMSKRITSEELPLGPANIGIMEIVGTAGDEHQKCIVSDNVVFTTNEALSLQKAASPMKHVGLHSDAQKATSDEGNPSNLDLPTRKITCSPCIKNFNESGIRKIKLLVHPQKKDALKMNREGSTSEAFPGSECGLCNFLKSPEQEYGAEDPTEPHLSSGCNKAPLISDIGASRSIQKDDRHTLNIPFACSQCKVVPPSTTADQAAACCTNDTNGVQFAKVSLEAKPFKVSRKKGHQHVEMLPSSNVVAKMQLIESEIKCNQKKEIEALGEQPAFKRRLHEDKTCGTEVVPSSTTAATAQDHLVQHLSDEIMTESRKNSQNTQKTDKLIQKVGPSEMKVFKRRLHKSRSTCLEECGDDQTLSEALRSHVKAKVRKRFNHPDQKALRSHVKDKVRKSCNHPDQHQLGLKRKHYPSSHMDIKELDWIVGRMIDVWWPVDKRFYRGIIESFDPVSNKYKVLYEDGDVEFLLLSEERWKFTRNEARSEKSGDVSLISSDIGTSRPIKKDDGNTLNIPSACSLCKVVPPGVTAANQAAACCTKDTNGVQFAKVSLVAKPFKVSRKRGHQHVEILPSNDLAKIQLAESESKCNQERKIEASGEQLFKRCLYEGKTCGTEDTRKNHSPMVTTSKTASTAQGHWVQHDSNEIKTESRKNSQNTQKTDELIKKVEPSEMKVFKRRLHKRRSTCIEDCGGDQTLSDIKELDWIVGRMIDVWWPVDKRFYRGIIESFDPVSNKYKVLYEDGDVEFLLLSEERWKFTRNEARSGKSGDVGKPGCKYPENISRDGSTKSCSGAEAKIHTQVSARKIQVKEHNTKFHEMVDNDNVETGNLRKQSRRRSE